MAENARLASMQTGNGVEDPVLKSMERVVYPVESAVLINGPLPQEQGYTPSTVLRTLLHLMLILQSLATQLKKNGLKMPAVPDVHSQHPSKLQQFEQVHTHCMEPKTLRKAMQLLLKHPP